MPALIDIVEARATQAHRLFLRFEDGLEGELDIAALVRFEAVLAPLRDTEMFARVSINAGLGTVCWPNGADLDPDVLYAALSDTAQVQTPAGRSGPLV